MQSYVCSPRMCVNGRYDGNVCIIGIGPMCVIALSIINCNNIILCSLPN